MTALERALPRPLATLLVLAVVASAAPLRAQDPPKPTLAGQKEAADSAEAEAPAYYMMSGFVVTADRRPARSLIATGRTSAGSNSVAVRSDGTFTIIVPAGDGPVELIVDAADKTNRWYFPAWVSVRESRVKRKQGFVLVPRAWQIPAGRYAEQWVEVNLDKSFERISPTRSESFFMWQIDGSLDAKSRDRPNSWGLESLPIPVVFDRTRSAATIEPVDSTKFWNVLDSMEEDFGLDLFVPFRAEELAVDDEEERSADEDPIVGDDEEDRRSATSRAYDEAVSDSTGVAGVGRLIRVWVPDELNRSTLGMASRRMDQGKMSRGWVMIARRRWFRDHVIVKHEFMHALGFGHTCAWPSAVTGPMCYNIALDKASEFDVAHVQLSLNINALQRRTGARYGVVAAWNGQKRVMTSTP